MLPNPKPFNKVIGKNFSMTWLPKKNSGSVQPSALIAASLGVFGRLLIVWQRQPQSRSPCGPGSLSPNSDPCSYVATAQLCTVSHQN